MHITTTRIPRAFLGVPWFAHKRWLKSAMECRLHGIVTVCPLYGHQQVKPQGREFESLIQRFKFSSGSK